jgi:xylulose-5-phosphate/fructose-6-phosphate phosphoketolase
MIKALSQTLVMAAAGDVTAQEALATAIAPIRNFPDLKIRFVNVVDLAINYNPIPECGRSFGFGLESTMETNQYLQFPRLSLVNSPSLAYRRTNHDNLHVRGYKER